MKYRLAIAIGGALLLSACLQPKGTIAFVVGGKREFRNAQLFPPASAERRDAIRLKFADTNTFQTTATLAPGNYIFSAMTLEGLYMSREVRIEEGKRRYDIEEMKFGSIAQHEGPKVTGGLYVDKGELPREVVVLFIGSDFIVRHAQVSNQRFSANSPVEGTYRIEVHALGNPPRSWIRDGVAVKSDMDLGIISLR